MLILNTNVKLSLHLIQQLKIITAKVCIYAKYRQPPLNLYSAAHETALRNLTPAMCRGTVLPAVVHIPSPVASDGGKGSTFSTPVS